MGCNRLANWHNKAMWLALVGLLFIAALGLTVGNVVLFVAGAVGGFLSRLGRILKIQPKPTDYGAHWTTLFLSPVAGALAGWAGILVVTLLSRQNILGSLFHRVSWERSLDPLVLALAFVLGFSERLFTGFIEQVEKTTPGK